MRPNRPIVSDSDHDPPFLSSFGEDESVVSMPFILLNERYCKKRLISGLAMLFKTSKMEETRLEITLVEQIL